MTRDHARVNVAIWNDPDFRNLPAPAQHLYLTLWTSPGLSYCGTHDWRPARLTPLTGGSTADELTVAAACLQARHFLVIDEATEEALVRSWARFDGLMKQPRMAVSFVSAYTAVASPILRQVVVYEAAKIQREAPNLACWNDGRVAEMLTHPATSAKDLPVPEDPFAQGFGGWFTPGLAQTLPKVCLPPTPYSLLHAPTPSPYSDAPSASEAPADEATQGRASTDAPDTFAAWWDAYDHKKGKVKAIPAYKRALRKTDAETLLTSALAYIAGKKRTGSHPAYTMNPTTWLNGEHWNDETTSNVVPMVDIADLDLASLPPVESSWMRRSPS